LFYPPLKPNFIKFERHLHPANILTVKCGGRSMCDSWTLVYLFMYLMMLSTTCIQVVLNDRMMVIEIIMNRKGCGIGGAEILPWNFFGGTRKMRNDIRVACPWPRI
jgi:hypothetical protein